MPVLFEYVRYAPLRGFYTFLYHCKTFEGLLTQWLEYSAFNRLVPGSSPGQPNLFLNLTFFLLQKPVFLPDFTKKQALIN